MKQGQTLAQLAKELQRQANVKKDFVAAAGALQLDQNGLFHVGERSYDALPTMHEQLAVRLGIPHSYYDRMRTAEPALLSTNVNTWLQHKEREQVRYMVRTLDSGARALLSDRYRPLDNYDLAQAILPQLGVMQCDVKSCALTERRLYLKAVIPSVSAEVTVGDVVQSGLVISNSEIGLGAIKIEPFIYRLVCKNGAIINELAHRKTHVGRRHPLVEGLQFDTSEAFYKSETREADDKAFWLKVRDVVAAHASPTTFRTIVERWREATTQKITGDPVKVVELTAKRFGLADSESRGVVQHLLSGGDLSAYGLMNAITRTSHDVEQYDRATELERIGPMVLELAQPAWDALASTT